MASPVITQGRPSFRRSLPGETAKAFAAFCDFRDMGTGHDRVLRVLAETHSYAYESLTYWSAKFQWKDRCRLFDEVMSHARAEQAKADMLAGMHKEYSRRQAARLKTVDALRKVAEETVEKMGVLDLLGKPNTILNILKYIDTAEKDMFAPVRTEEQREADHAGTAIDVGSMTDEQLDALLALTASLNGEPGDAAGGEGEEVTTFLPERGVADLQPWDDVSGDLAHGRDLRSPGGGDQRPDSPPGDQHAPSDGQE